MSSSNSQYKLFQMCMDTIRSNHFEFFDDFFEYLLENKQTNCLDLVIKNPHLFQALLQSCHERSKESGKQHSLPTRKAVFYDPDGFSEPNDLFAPFSGFAE